MQNEPEASRAWLTKSPAMPCSLMVVLVVLACLNALSFAMQAVNPLIASDNWHFVEVLLRDAAGGEVSAADLFYKRGALDHSQPLRKLILLFHYKYFSLDFSVETVIAMVAAFLNLALFWFVARGTSEGGRAVGLAGGLLFAALAAVYLSLNSSMVFSWSLVTLNFTSHTFLLLLVVSAWACIVRPTVARYVQLFVVALLAGIVADDSALIAIVAVVVTTLLYSVRLRVPRRSLWIIVATVAAFACYSLLYASISGSGNPGAGAISMSGRFADLAPRMHEAWRWLAIPLASSVAHRMQLQEALGAGSESAVIAIAVLVLAAHAWFWWCAFRGRANLASFLASNIMLLFYGLVSGMVLARVSEFGSDYLWQPRYSLIYQWNIVALLLMAIGQFGISSPTPRDRPAGSPVRDGAIGSTGRIVAAVGACLLLAIQVPLSLSSWNSLKYLDRYEQRMAFQMGELARDPSTAPSSCAPTLVVCRLPPERRRRLMRFLQDNRLNLFSPDFQARHRLTPDADAMAR